jgi:spermidine synthase
MFAAVSLAYFLSGAAGLIFEVVWFHRASLVFGNSVWAASLVLSSFMAGLALGNASVAWRGTSLRRPLRAYAVVEMIAAVAGVAVTALVPVLPAVVVPLTRLAGDTQWAINFLRFATAFIALLLPAAAMGATLPLLAGAMTRGGSSFGDVLGRLYGWNTLGAVAGGVLAEVVLVARVGVTATAWVAALLNVSAAAVVWSLSTPLAIPAVRTPPPTSPAGRPQPIRVLAAPFAAGAALLALEVIWFRFLSMYVLTTTLAVSLMLTAVLTAIGVGGLVASWWLRRQPHAAIHAPAIACAAGCAVIASYASFQILTRDVQVGDWWRVLWFAGVLTGPCSLLSGMLFTLLGDTVKRATAGPTSAAAWLSLANTTGAMCGPPLAAFVLLPRLGMERAFFALASGYGAAGVLAWSVTREVRAERPARPTRTGWIAGAGLLVALALFPFGLSSKYFARIAEPYTNDGSAIVATREGAAETILLLQQHWLGQAVYSRLVTNGFSMSGTAVPGQRYMRDFVYWPLLLHRSPLRRVLVICYGVGVTAGAAVDLPGAESIDVVELSRDIVSMSDVIYPPAARPLRDARVRLHIEDGRSFLQTTAGAFDLITGEPPPPRTPGAANIYTREYFQLVHDRLAEGGITTYWLPVARPQPGADVNTIVRGFCDVFHDCSLWNATPFDFMLVGTKHAVPQTAEGLASAWRHPLLAARLSEVGFERPEQIGATFLGDAAYLGELTAAAPPLTDDFPHRIVPVTGRVSLSDPRYRDDPAAIDLFQRVLDPVRAREAFAASPFIARVWPVALRAATLPFFPIQRIVNRVLWEGGQPLQQVEDLHAVLTATSLRTLPLWLLGSDEVKQRIAEGTAERSRETEYARGLRAFSTRDYLGAAAHLGEAERLGLTDATVRALQVYALCLAGDAEAARVLARGVVPRGADQVHFWTWLHATFGITAGS